MTAPTIVPTNMSKRAMTALIALGTVKFMCVTATQAIDQDGQIFISSVNANEAAGTNYPTGGVPMTGVVLNVDTSTNATTLDADDITTAGLSVVARWGYIYVDTGTPSTSAILAITDCSQGAGGNVTITGYQFDAAGILALVAA